MKPDAQNKQRPRGDVRASSPPRPIEFLESRTLLTAGQLDLSFGNLGQAVQPVEANLRAHADSVARQADGKILVAGYASQTWIPYYSVARYTAAGQLDLTFGNAGRATITGVVLPVDQPVIVMVQKSGRILLAAGNPADFRVYALRPDGSPDRTFGNNGVSVVKPATQTSVVQHAAVLLPDQSVLLGGWVDDYAQPRAAWVHLLADGKIDPAYGKSPRLLPTSAGKTEIRRMTVLGDGSVLAAGVLEHDALLFKLSPTGDVVATFGDAGGLARVDLGSAADESGDALTALSGGDVVLAGTSDGNVALARLNGAGKIVSTFGTGGVARFNVGDPDGTAGITLAASGRLLVAGGSSVVAVKQSGTIDTTYGSGGIAAVDFGPTTDTAGDAINGPNGTLLVVGRAVDAGAPDGPNLFGLQRLTAAGAPDATFAAGTGTPGGVTTPILGAARVGATHLARQPDGKVIVFSGWDLNDSGVEFTRLNRDGTLDTSFGDSGHVRLRPWLNPGDVVIDSKGRILGVTTSVVIRLLPSGKLDSTFARNGILTVNPEANRVAGGIALTAGDGFVIASGGEGAFTFARFDEAGRPDPTFGTAGRVTIKSPGAPAGRNANVNRLIALPDGKLVALGEAPLRGSLYQTSYHSAFAVVRVTAAGAPDTTFGNGGVAVTSFATGGETQEWARAAAILPDGRLLVVGTSYEQTTSTFGRPKVAMVLYRVNGTPDPTFHGTGKLLTNYQAGASDWASAVIRDADGRFLVAGSTWVTTDAPPVIGAIRVSTTGQVDPTFADHGVLLLKGTGQYAANGVDLIAQPDGKLLLAAAVHGATNVWRLLDDATPAPTARVINGVLTVTGTGGPDLIRLTRSGNTVSLTGFPTTFAIGTFSRITVSALDGNDRIDAVNIDLPITVNGGNGNDVILGGAGHEALFGDAGNDTIFGGRGDDVIHGGDGNDYISGGPGRNALYGDAGNDQILALNTLPDVVDGGAGFDRAKYDPYDSRKSIEGLLA